ncbi:putative glycosyltransferase [Lentibacillus sp. JNUCC-1]|uniref:glycosyltransferase family 2 protein n=1 Tax=Lentibacillus sp. JNUCC-1 TaxID=2654513 RepID=UPI0012E7E57B|nr:glycosyltransferase family 2 protein [Lentibacillus sp. JNUCC-1]MUV36921.1 putative glycosyltransferase [Lentibacillus sp. JNUCC-1]
MKQLTIFTPTYNRAHTLPACYASLKRQRNQDFKWLIIDDGSTDGTQALVEAWQQEQLIHIDYVRQSNQGMHGAHNTAYDRINTELNVCLDSDDFMPPDAVEKILSFWNQHGSDQYSGLVGLNTNTKGDLIGTKWPAHLKASSLFDLYYKHGVTGDKKLVYRTELTRQYPYPLFENERYVGLAYKYYQLDRDYELLLMDETLCCVEYLADGSSRNMLFQYRKNPQGFSFYRKALMKLPFATRAFQFRQAIHYVSSSFMSRNRAFIQETPRKALTIMALPLGTVLFWYIKMKTRVT